MKLSKKMKVDLSTKVIISIYGLISLVCVLMILVIIPKLESDYNNEMSLEYQTTTRIITDSIVSFENICRKSECSCENTQTNITCEENIINQIEGICNGGSFCCQFVSDICVLPECFQRFRCDCTKTYREINNEYGTDPISVFNEKCTGYKCYGCGSTHECNRRCIYSVSNQKCRTDCGLIYTIDYSFIHIPSKLKEINNQNYELVITCLQNLTNCIGLYSNDNYLYKNNGQIECSSLDINCMDEYGLNVGNTSEMYVKMSNSNLLQSQPFKIPEFPKREYQILTYIITGGLIIFTMIMSVAYYVLNGQQERFRLEIESLRFRY